MAKQVRLRRGTTAEHADFTGANGEITVDTVKHVVIVHDGATAGGWPSANATAVDNTLSVLTANAANQAASINTLLANAATQANLLTSLISNASVQQASIDAFILASNATAIFANISAINANLDAANAAISSLIGNATVQSEAIVLANANIIALQSGLTAANVTIASFVTGSGFANIGQLTANITAVNSAISTQGTTFATNVAVAGIRANVTAANLEIVKLQANIAAANLAIGNIVLSPALVSSIAILVNNAYATSYQLSSNIDLVNANIAAANAAITSLQSNAATQAQLIANVSGTYGNANVATYLSAFDGNIVPTQANVYTLGTPEKPWNHLYVGTGSITIGNVTLSDNNGNLSIKSAAEERVNTVLDSISSVYFNSVGISRWNSVEQQQTGTGFIWGMPMTWSHPVGSGSSPFPGNDVGLWIRGSYGLQLDGGWEGAGVDGYHAWEEYARGDTTAFNIGSPGTSNVAIETVNPTRGNVSVTNANLTIWAGNLRFSNASGREGFIDNSSGIIFPDLSRQTTAFSNIAVSTYLANFDGAINFTASPALITGLGNISSAKVWTGNLEFIDGSYQTTANIMAAAFTMANSQHWTSAVSTIGEALNQLAERIYNIENP